VIGSLCSRSLQALLIDRVETLAPGRSTLSTSCRVVLPGLTLEPVAFVGLAEVAEIGSPRIFFAQNSARI
jgi:hypothetical protein